MRYSKYDVSDLLKIKNGEATMEDIAKQYGSSVGAIRVALSRARIYRRKRMVKVVTNNKVIHCGSIEECARVVGVSSPLIKSYLDGKYSPLIAELDIQIEEEVPDYEQDY